MLCLRLMVIMCLSIAVAFGEDLNQLWKEMEGKNLSNNLGQCKVGPIPYTFNIPNGTITDGIVFRKGVWKWAGKGASYIGIVVSGDEASEAEHCGWFNGQYVIQGTGGNGEKLKWKAQLRGCGEDYDH